MYYIYVWIQNEVRLFSSNFANMELWNSIVHDLTYCKQKNASEEQYHQEIKSVFIRLGWWRSGSLKSKERISHGAAKDLIPDIQLLKDGKEVLVVEIKKPENILTSRQVEQLGSYMHELKMPIGMYIGENIQLFYEAEDEKTPSSVYTIEINEDNAEGKELCEMLDYAKFDYEELKSFCIKQKQIKEIEQNSRIKLNEFFEDEHCVNNIKELLKEKFLSEGLDKKVVSDVLNDICITVGESTPKVPSPIIEHRREIIKFEYGNNKGKLPRYSINGSYPLSQGRFVLEFVRRYIKDNPTLTYSELLRRLPKDIQGTYGIINSYNEAKTKWIAHNKPYFYDDILVSGDGVKIVVSSQWQEPKTDNVMKLAKRLNYNIEKM